jgi:hypothetical protein
MVVLKGPLAFTYFTFYELQLRFKKYVIFIVVTPNLFMCTYRIYSVYHLKCNSNNNHVLQYKN